MQQQKGWVRRVLILFLASTCLSTAMMIAAESATSEESQAQKLEALQAHVSALVRQALGTRPRAAKKRAYEAALPEAERLVAMRSDPESLRLLATAQLGADRLVEARTTSELWTASDPQSWKAYFALGRSWYYAEEYPEALGPLKRAFSLAIAEADRRTVARGYGIVLEKLRRLEEALAVYEEVGDVSSAVRVREIIQILESSKNGSSYHGPPPGLDDEARRLEEELRALEQADQGGGEPLPGI